MQSQVVTLETHSAEQTRALGRALGELLSVGDLVCLSGPLGAGKTVFAAGIGDGLEVTAPVRSPSFVLVREHAGRLPMYHVDAYRLEQPFELQELGLPEWLERGIVVIEWADRVASALPEERITVTMEHTEGGRRICISGAGERAESVVADLSGNIVGQAGHGAPALQRRTAGVGRQRARPCT